MDSDSDIDIYDHNDASSNDAVVQHKSSNDSTSSYNSSKELSKGKKIRRRIKVLDSDSDGSCSSVEYVGQFQSPKKRAVNNLKRSHRQFKEESSNPPESDAFMMSTSDANSLNHSDSYVSHSPSASESKEEEDRYESDSSMMSSTNEDIDENDLNHADSFVEPDPGFYNANDRTARTARNRKSHSSSSRKNNSSPQTADDGSSDFELDSQEVSIHRINMSHVALKNKMDEESIIKQIIKIYNEPQGKRPPQDFFLKEIIKNPPKLETEDEDQFIGPPFKLKIYIQNIKKRIPLLSQYGIKTKAFIVNSLIFHYRKGEIFVLTTGAAWNAVQWCSDFNFPGKIAARILSKQGTSSKTVKGLIGDNLVSTKKTKTAAEANPFNLLTFCTSFTASIRENASILKLSCFASTYDQEDHKEQDDEHDSPAPSTSTAKRRKIVKKKKFNVNRSFSVRIQTGSIRIQKRFTKSDFLSICGHLSLIANGKETMTLDNKTEVDSSAHEQYLTVVHTELAKKLDIKLAKKIHSAIADDRRLDGISNFEIHHKHSTDFFDGSNFKLFYKKREIKSWDYKVPSCRDVILALRDVDELTRVNQKGMHVAEDYLKKLAHAKLSYLKRDAKNPVSPEKVLNFIQGMLSSSSDNNVFWHVQSIWCIVQHSYLLLVQSKFKDFLQGTLKPCELEYPWVNSSEDSDIVTKTYVKRYKSLPNFFIPSYKDSLVDMIEITMEDEPGHFSLIFYFILPGLNCHSLRRMSDVIKFFVKIQKAVVYRDTGNEKVAGSEIAADTVKRLFSNFLRKKETLCGNMRLRDFEKILKDAKVIFAVGQDPQCSNQRSLQQELELQNKITVLELVEIFQSVRSDADKMEKLRSLAHELGISHHSLSNANMKILAMKLLDLLVEEEFISEDGSITGKFHCQTRSSFLLPNLTNSVHVYELIVLPLQAQAGTFLAKLELINLKEKLEKIMVRGFSIVEIQEADGESMSGTDEADISAEEEEDQSDGDDEGNNDSNGDED